MGDFSCLGFLGASDRVKFNEGWIHFLGLLRNKIRRLEERFFGRVILAIALNVFQKSTQGRQQVLGCH
jgi:hypothetical protein